MFLRLRRNKVKACFSISCVKYLLKYVHKGHHWATFALEVSGPFDAPDHATVQLRAESADLGDRPVVNEIDDYANGRWV